MHRARSGGDERHSNVGTEQAQANSMLTNWVSPNILFVSWILISILFLAITLLFIQPMNVVYSKSRSGDNTKAPGREKPQPGEFLAFENKNSNQRRIKHPKIKETSNDKCDWKNILRAKRVPWGARLSRASVIGKYVASEASYVKPGELPALENKNSIQRLIKHLKIRVTPDDKCD